jgi:hypothetical protein
MRRRHERQRLLHHRLRGVGDADISSALSRSSVFPAVVSDSQLSQ